MTAASLELLAISWLTHETAGSGFLIEVGRDTAAVEVAAGAPSPSEGSALSEMIDRGNLNKSEGSTERVLVVMLRMKGLRGDDRESSQGVTLGESPLSLPEGSALVACKLVALPMPSGKGESLSAPSSGIDAGTGSGSPCFR